MSASQPARDAARQPRAIESSRRYRRLFRSTAMKSVVRVAFSVVPPTSQRELKSQPLSAAARKSR
jgi:hypothetical protein